jgi:hypothetical protein
MELIGHLPPRQANEMKRIYETMVEARQNCEAIAFRGHRLLDQVRGGRGQAELGTPLETPRSFPPCIPSHLTHTHTHARTSSCPHS